MPVRRRRVTIAHVLLAAAVVAAAGSIACDRVPLTAPTQSFIQLFATGSSVPPDGSLEIVANVTEQAGTPVQNGTVVTFVTSLGRVDPAEARTHNGKATTRLIADGRSGVATVTAFSGAAESATLEIPIGAAAIGTFSVSASPATLPSGGGSSQITARARDAAGNPLAGVSVSFSTTAGTVSPEVATTDAAGEARTTLTTTRDATVTARAAQEEADVTVTVDQALTLTVSVSPNPPVEGLTTEFIIVVTVPPGGAAADRLEVNFGDGNRTSLRIPSSGGTTTLSHVYDRDGTFTVGVTVVDSNGGRQTQQIVVTVVAAP
ncbi:MAG TPA: Ig-like domain-containing protein [Vicinamibacterales bacterium]